MNDPLAIFTAIDTLVLERTSGRRFRCLGAPPAWCEGVWSSCKAGASELVPEVPFPFLEVFLAEAERAWAAPARVDSETWTVVDAHEVEIHLQATAVRVASHELLLVTRCDTLHRARQLLLQRARELRLADDAAARASEQKDALLHCIIDDLQVPLNTLLGTLTRLADLAESGEIGRLAAMALGSAQRQRNLILEILQVFAPDPLPVGAGDLVVAAEHAIALFQPVAHARGQELGWEGARRSAPALVSCEASRLERVVAQLVEEAVANALAQVSLRVTDDGDFACLAIDDDGPELKAGSARESLAPLGDRRGLGLYVCRVTVERGGGSVVRAARPGGGNRLLLRLPRVTNGRPAAPRSAAGAR